MRAHCEEQAPSETGALRRHARRTEEARCERAEGQGEPLSLTLTPDRRAEAVGSLSRPRAGPSASDPLSARVAAAVWAALDQKGARARGSRQLWAARWDQRAGRKEEPTCMLRHTSPLETAVWLPQGSACERF